MLRCLDLNLKSIEVLKMENKCLIGYFCPSDLDPTIHGVFREVTKAENGTLNGTYTKEAIKALEWAMDELDGKLERVELVDPEVQLLLTHTINDDKPNIFRKNERTDLTEFVINKVPIEFLNQVKQSAIDHFPNERNKLSCLTNYGMDLYVKVKKGFVKLVETQKKLVRSFISDEGGQVSSIDGNSILGVFEFLTSKVIELQNDIKDIKESTVQSASNISSKVVGKARKLRDGKGKSVKAEAKLDKAERILNNLKKRYEHRFTNEDYEEPLSKFTKQGDERTVRSDLKVLEAAGLIKKVRSSANGEETYEFTENNQYHLYNNDLAKNRFFDDVKEKFFMDDEFRVKDLNDFIFEKYEFFDDESQNKRLKWLISEGLVTRHPVNPHILKVQK